MHCILDLRMKEKHLERNDSQLSYKQTHFSISGNNKSKARSDKSICSQKIQLLYLFGNDCFLFLFLPARNSKVS